MMKSSRSRDSELRAAEGTQPHDQRGGVHTGSSDTHGTVSKFLVVVAAIVLLMVL